MRRLSRAVRPCQRGHSGIKAGTTVALEGYASTRVEREMRAERITVNGKAVELRWPRLEVYTEWLRMEARGLHLDMIKAGTLCAKFLLEPLYGWLRGQASAAAWCTLNLGAAIRHEQHSDAQRS
jgi:hypothetical protein